MTRNKKIWIFNAGNSFNGNPKWLFIYINQNRKDIKAYWLSNDKETLKTVRRLGFKAYAFESYLGKRIQKQAGVFVVNQVKEKFPPLLVGCTILNLWHGVGCKTIERKLKGGILAEKVSQKYIRYNQIYKNNQLFLVTSPLMEKHFKEQCGIDDNKVIKAGYPCCERVPTYSSFNHNIKEFKRLPNETKIAVYTPTFREKSLENFFGKAIPDMEELITSLKRNNLLLIFKLHPLMEKDYVYNLLKKKYSSCPNLLFWDNRNDIYEIFDQIDLAIIDYSSMFYDMLAAGVPYYIRYIFDYEDKDNLRDFVFDYKKMTFGTICNNFDELLKTLENYTDQDFKERDKIYKLFWEYSQDTSMEDIIEKALDFSPQTERKLPTLHSYDIFDTILRRQTTEPVGIFYHIQEKIKSNRLLLSEYVIQYFPQIRRWAEANARQYKRKTLDLRDNNDLEISLDDIYKRIQEVYSINEKDIQRIKEFELEAEFENSAGIEERVKEIEALIDKGEDVILISDMYLPEEFIKRLLEKTSPKIAKLPIYLSSTWGVQKTTKGLFLKAYEGIDYNYRKWRHYGDNKKADYKMPQELGIETVKYETPKFNQYEKTLVEKINTYDAYLVATLMQQFRTNHNEDLEYFSFAYVSLYLVPYISWVIEDAIAKKFDTLYFIARDGHYLKIIADTIIKNKGYKIKTKYIYGSRKAWRIPSFIDHIDESFYQSFGNFSGVDDYESLLNALHLQEKDFLKLFPQLESIKDKAKLAKEDLESISFIVKNSKEYTQFLLDIAKKERVLVTKYLKQEINFQEKFAFVEYWGRGYTQDCLTRLIEETVHKKIENPFYYVRSIYPSRGSSIRYNFTTNPSSPIFVEAIFANLPYDTTASYRQKGENIEPVHKWQSNTQTTHLALEQYLPIFAEEYSKCKFTNPDNLGRSLFDFSFEYFNLTPRNPLFVKYIAPLDYSGSLNSKTKNFAVAFKFKDLQERLFGIPFSAKTYSLEMSLARSSKIINLIYTARQKAIEYGILGKIRRIVKFIRKRV